MAENREIVLAPGTAGAGDADAGSETGSVFFVGTATVIIRYAGFVVLTDPNFLHKGDHVHLGYGLTAERLTEPAIPIEALPPVDLVLLSHLHEDHFDRLVAEKLDKGLPILTTPQAARGLARLGFRNVHALDCWEAVDVRKGEGRLRVTAMPARHGPPVLARALPDTMGSLLELDPTGTGLVTYRIYISGDTVMYEGLREIAARTPDIDLALIHLGGTRLLGLLLVTMDARQGVEAVRAINAHVSIPIHYDDYTVFKSSLEEFQAEVERAGLAGQVRYLLRGETFAFAPAAVRAAKPPAPAHPPRPEQQRAARRPPPEPRPPRPA